MEPGFKSVYIQPYLPPSMHRVQCVYESVSGPIEVAIQETEDTIQVELHIAKEITWQFDAKYLISSGKDVIIKER